MYLDHTCKGFFMHFGKGPEISEKNGKQLMEGLIGSFNRYLAHASTVVKPTHMKIPCMTPPTTSQAYTVFNTVDKNNSNTISWSELLKAWKVILIFLEFWGFETNMECVVFTCF